MRPLWAIRTDPPAAELVAPVREIINAALPGVRIRRDQPLSAVASSILGMEQMMATMALIFGGLAVSLAAIGLYGVLAFHVSTRRREIGVRIALGAGVDRVVGMIVRQSLMVVALGAVLGVPLAIVAGKGMRGLLYGITPSNPMPILVAAGVLVATGVLASLIPSLTAAKVDPLIAMRAE